MSSPNEIRRTRAREFNQYHEPPEELSPEPCGTKARLFVSPGRRGRGDQLVRAAALGRARRRSQGDAKNASTRSSGTSMDLEFAAEDSGLAGNWRKESCSDGDIVEHGEAAEAGTDEEDEDATPEPAGSGGRLELAA